MVKSMTAFARQESSADWGVLTLECRSVNHRFLEMNFRLPEEFRAIESKIRSKISKKLNRGKFDLFVRYVAPQNAEKNLLIDQDLAAKVVASCQQIDALIGNPAMLNSIEVLRWPGVMVSNDTSSDLLQEAMLTLLDVALDEIVESRAREGAKLQQIIQSRCDSMSTIVKSIRIRLPEINQLVKDKMMSRLQDIQLDLDANRFAQEVAYLVQKLDVDEEMDRLETHITEVQRVLLEQKPIGRRLDFLMQELNREANTLGSKSADTQTTNFSVELKVLIEQIREQVQNIE